MGSRLGPSTSDLICRSCKAVSSDTRQSLPSVFRRAVAEPIVDLSKIAKVVSQDKNYSVRATPVRSPAELAILIDAFNEMLAQIQESEGALRMARDELEQRVRERTAELEAAKREVEEFSHSVLLA